MDYNHVAFSGRLGQDPKMRYTSQGMAVANFSVAVQLAKDKTMWHEVTVWGKQAENVSQYLEKGSSVIVDGRLDLDEWTDDDGKKRTKQRVVANYVRFLGSPKKGNGGQQQSGTASVGPLEQEVSSPISDNDFPI